MSADRGPRSEREEQEVVSSKPEREDVPSRHRASSDSKLPAYVILALGFTVDMLSLVNAFSEQGTADLAIKLGSIVMILTASYFKWVKKKHWHTALVAVLLAVAVVVCIGGVASKYIIDFSFAFKGDRVAVGGSVTPQPVTPSSSAPTASSAPTVPGPPTVSSVPSLPAQPPTAVSQPGTSIAPSGGVIVEPTQGPVPRCVTAKGSGVAAPNHVWRVGTRTLKLETYYPLRAVQYEGNVWTTVGQLTVGAEGDVSKPFEIVIFDIPAEYASTYERDQSVAHTKAELEHDRVRTMSPVSVTRLNKVEGKCL